MADNNPTAKIPEMIKRVATVIAGARIDMARAVIEAMREPTAAMIDASPYLGPEAEGTPSEVWRAMIDTALKE